MSRIVLRYLVGLVVGAVMCSSLPSASAVPPTASVTGTAPGVGQGSINVSWTYANCPGATTVKVEAFDPATGALVGAATVPSVTPGAATVHTTAFAATVNLKVTVRNGNQVIVTVTSSGMTR